jgi:hypothetical protein
MDKVVLASGLGTVVFFFFLFAFCELLQNFYLKNMILIYTKDFP